MTIIATDGKTIAFDSMVVCGAVRVGSMEKVVEIAPKIFVGGTGDQEDVQSFIEWQKACMVSGRVPKPTLDEGFSGIMFNARTGEVWSYERKLFPMRVSVPYAIGAPGDVALGAMMAGCGPRLAVEIAIQASPLCGGDITELPAPIPVVEHEEAHTTPDSDHPLASETERKPNVRTQRTRQGVEGG